MLSSYNKINFDHFEKMASECEFEVSLRQSFIISIEKETRAILENGLSENEKSPDYLELIYEEPLKEIFPQNVDIIQ